MMHVRQIWKVVSGWPGLCALLACSHWLGLAGAAPYGPDPVDDFRQALKLQVFDVKNTDELDYRKGLLEKRAKALRNADIRRALALLEWKDTDKDEGIASIDRTVRRDLIKRFTDWVTELFKRTDRGSIDAQLGAVTTLSEMGITLRGEADKTALARDLGPALAGLVQDSPFPAVRQAAARALGRINPEPKLASDALAKLLASQDPLDRLAAADGLASLVRVLGQMTKGRQGASNVEVLPEDAVVTGQLVATKAGAGLGDPDPGVRRFALEAIQLSAAVLDDLIGDPPQQEFPPTDRKLTAQEQKQIEDYRKLVEGRFVLVQPLADALAQQIGGVTQCLNNWQPVDIRLLADQTLAEMGYARQRLVRYANSVPRLEAKPGGAARRLPRPRTETGTLVLVAAQQPADPLKSDPLGKGLLKAIEPLTLRLQDPDVWVRIGALEALIALGDAAKPATAAAIAALRDPDHFVRWAAVRLLGKIRPDDPAQVVLALIPLLRDPDLDVELATATTLALYGRNAAAAVPALNEHLEFGASAIFSYASCWPPTYGHIRFREDMGDAEMRLAAIRTLQAIGAEAAAAGAVKALTINLLDRDVRVRKAAADAIAQFGSLARSAAPNLRRLLDDPDPEVRKAAGDALLAILIDK